MNSARLQAFRERLLQMRGRLVREVNQLIESIPNEGQPVGEISHVPSHNADRDSDGVDKEVALVENEEGLLAAVNAALARIEEGVFGRCEGCQGTIALERLDALPYAPLCIGCAQRGVQV